MYGIQPSTGHRHFRWMIPKHLYVGGRWSEHVTKGVDVEYEATIENTGNHASRHRRGQQFTADDGQNSQSSTRGHFDGSVPQHILEQGKKPVRRPAPATTVRRSAQQCGTRPQQQKEAPEWREQSVTIYRKRPVIRCTGSNLVMQWVALRQTCFSRICKKHF